MILHCISALPTIIGRANLRRLTIILLFILPIILWGQTKTEKFFFDDNWESCDSVTAKYVSVRSNPDQESKKGTIRIYLLTGQLISDRQYSDVKLSRLDGVSKNYYENGILQSESNFVGGKLNGELTTFYTNGQLRRKDKFENDMLVSGNCYTIEGKDTTHFDYLVMPQYPGGEVALQKYISENVKYPGKARRKEISGTVIVAFVVNKYGIVSKVRVLQSVDNLLDREAVWVVKLMPRWKPGLLEGEKASVLFNLPIIFKLK